MWLALGPAIAPERSADPADQLTQFFLGDKGDGCPAPPRTAGGRWSARSHLRPAPPPARRPRRRRPRHRLVLVPGRRLGLGDGTDPTVGRGVVGVRRRDGSGPARARRDRSAIGAPALEQPAAPADELEPMLRRPVPVFRHRQLRHRLRGQGRGGALGRPGEGPQPPREPRRDPSARSPWPRDPSKGPAAELSRPASRCHSVPPVRCPRGPAPGSRWRARGSSRPAAGRTRPRATRWPGSSASPRRCRSDRA